MLFNSHPFIFAYFPIALIGFFCISFHSARLAAIWLVTASILFYGWWNATFVPLLLGSIIFNYGTGYLIARTHRTDRSKSWLLFGIFVNLTILSIFKYANFFISTANDLGAHLNALNIVLPIGISFFTFTQIAFLVDVHRGISREYNFIHYTLFVTWFPHLIAGPVLHHRQMMPQFDQPQTYRLSFDSLSVGMTWFTIGLLKKVILADHFALYSSAVYDAVDAGVQPTLVDAWVGALGYAFQIYFDFSGYSDMALGISRAFNVNLPLNFNSPYKATSIIEFWRRWHMSLSAFLKEYLYVPLGGNRNGPAHHHINIMLTMLLGGLWHGASWNFVLWGAIHGIYLIVNHCWRALAVDWFSFLGRARKRLSLALTFLAVVFAWIPFRATNLDASITMLRSMIGLNGISLPVEWSTIVGTQIGDSALSYNGLITLVNLRATELLWPVEQSIFFWLVCGLLIVWMLPNTQEILEENTQLTDKTAIGHRFSWRPNLALAMIIGVALSIAILRIRPNSPFLYFQF